MTRSFVRFFGSTSGVALGITTTEQDVVVEVVAVYFTNTKNSEVHNMNTYITVK